MFRHRSRKGNFRNCFKHKPVMKILHISDTHNHHRQLQDFPAADVIVHSGDFTMAGTEAEVIDFMEQFCALPYKHKVFIARNHDYSLFGADVNGLPENCHYLYGNGITIEGINLFGIPMFVEDDISGNYTKMLENIPFNTDVLITHQLPYLIMDESAGLHYGNRTLLDAVKRIKPKVHLFGRIHNAYGMNEYRAMLFSNASIVTDNYEFGNQTNMINL